MRPNETRRKLEAGQPAVGIFVSSASAIAAEIVGGLGFDWVLVDLQHGENNLGNLSTMLQAVSITGATPFVRVPINEPMQIGRALDLGAYGIIVPLVNSRAEAEALVRGAKYHPRGGRSWGPIRGSLYGGADYFEHADRETMLFAMIETVEAVENAREILSVDGIDGCLVGPNDLSITHGLGPEGGEALAPEVEKSIEDVVAACESTGKIAGMQVYSAASANRRIEQGFRLIGLGTELRSMRAALLSQLGAVQR
jgi:4-hydroxy-2-oxoheptanedioate aldolase